MKNISLSSRYGLIFHAENPLFTPVDRDRFIEQLQTAGFIGEFFQSAQHQGFLIGDEFLKLITFLGCSPKIALQPPQNRHDWINFCYIELKQLARPIFVSGLKRLKCCCCRCKSRIEPLKFASEECAQTNSFTDQWSSGTQSIQCPECHHNALLEELNWKHSAGFGQFFIIIHSVYPHEAVPADKLLDLLQILTRQTWQYFYFEQ